ncbi:hypothetical protein ES332_D03G202300v1 [Gossypium tomentosum]|uniref:Uncharacterized protein n=1 Tax=Gossypium tomentosum TaxID=34277 RepID=A0A5D2LR66_GOSTO|nr:hypothetical protein ES332_D03G202300v1 [Gossypium tomentosum]
MLACKFLVCRQQDLLKCFKRIFKDWLCQEWFTWTLCVFHIRTNSNSILNLLLLNSLDNLIGTVKRIQ